MRLVLAELAGLAHSVHIPALLARALRTTKSLVVWPMPGTPKSAPTHPKNVAMADMFIRTSTKCDMPEHCERQQ